MRYLQFFHIGVAGRKTTAPWGEFQTITPKEAADAVRWAATQKNVVEIYLNDEGAEKRGCPLVGFIFGENGYRCYGLGGPSAQGWIRRAEITQQRGRDWDGFFKAVIRCAKPPVWPGEKGLRQLLRRGLRVEDTAGNRGVLASNIVKNGPVKLPYVTVRCSRGYLHPDLDTFKAEWRLRRGDGGPRDWRWGKLLRMPQVTLTPTAPAVRCIPISNLKPGSRDCLRVSANLRGSLVNGLSISMAG